jgi:hypothetical protein
MSRPLSQNKADIAVHLAGSGRQAVESQEHSPRIIELKDNSEEPGTVGFTLAFI